VAGAAANHPGGERLDDVQRPEIVDLHHLLEDVEVLFAEIARMDRAGGVDDDVRQPRGFGDRVNGARDLSRVRDIRLDRAALLGRAGAAFPYLRQGMVEAGAIPRHQPNMSAKLAEEPGCRQSYAAGTARYEDNTILEGHYEDSPVFYHSPCAGQTGQKPFESLVA